MGRREGVGDLNREEGRGCGWLEVLRGDEKWHIFRRWLGLSEDKKINLDFELMTNRLL